MPFSGTTYSQIERGRAAVADIIARNKDRLNRLRAEAGLVVTDMTAAGTEYGPLVDASAALLATDPANQAFIVLNASIQQHLADFNSVSAEAAALDTKVNTP